MAEPLVQFRQKRIVVRICIFLVVDNVAKVLKGASCIAQPGPRLIQVERGRQMRSFGAEVIQLEQEILSQHTLKAQAPLLGVRRREMRIDAIGGVSIGRERRRKRIRIDLYGIGRRRIERLWVAEGRVQSQRVKPVQSCGLVVEDSVAATNHGVLVARGLPGETESWREILVIGIKQGVADAILAFDAQASSRNRGVEGRHLIVFFAGRRVVLPTQSQIDREIGRDLIVVLHEERGAGHTVVEPGTVWIPRRAGRQSHDHVGQSIAADGTGGRVGETEHASAVIGLQIGTEKLAPFPAELQRVLAARPGEVVDDLIGCVVTLGGQVGRTAQSREAGDRGAWQSAIVGQRRKEDVLPARGTKDCYLPARVDSQADLCRCETR